MVILISSRLIFTFSDVGDKEKNAIGIVLVIFLVGILARNVGAILVRKVKGIRVFEVSAAQIESLDDRKRHDLFVATMHYLTSNGVVEIEEDWAMKSDAAYVFDELFPRVEGKYRISVTGRPSVDGSPSPNTTAAIGTRMQIAGETEGAVTLTSLTLKPDNENAPPRPSTEVRNSQVEVVPIDARQGVGAEQGIPPGGEHLEAPPAYAQIDRSRGISVLPFLSQ
eukprot:TRINITY_DN30732_c0_g1_i3.p1 TRINITY_DN30732_c0_g1~~TRINITY_DN30732_c0_g1_i3.p1  ORF type:complete len:224 (-),score=64.56 TRINITY_DN30732_c0_g1_i3:34-705(-)